MFYSIIDVWSLAMPELGITEGNWGKSLGSMYDCFSQVTAQVPAHGTTVHIWHLDGSHWDDLLPTNRVLIEDVDVQQTILHGDL